MGGALFCEEVELLNVSHSTFADNRCYWWGGAIYTYGYQPITIERNIFVRNRAGSGGALYLNGLGDTEIRIVNNSFLGNYAGSGGAISIRGIFLHEAGSVISGNSFIRNYASFSGGALVLGHLTSIEVCHNVFARNSANESGGSVFFDHFSHVGLFHSNSVVYNESEIGGGICAITEVGGVIGNCIFWRNSADEGSHIFFYEDLEELTLSYCDIEGDWDGPGEHNIHEDPLFIDPDNNDFRLTEDSPCIDTGDPDSPEDPDGSRADIGAFYYNHEGPNPVRISIALAENWNLVSGWIEPSVRDIQTIFTPLVEREILLFVKDGAGRFYAPEFDFNSIPFWNFREGYLVKMAEADNLTIVGEPVAPETPIPLQRNWNTIAYFPEEEVEAPEAFANIEQVLIMAKDGEGRFYIPDREFNNMQPLRRGLGYMVKVSEAVELVWNVP